MEFQDGGVIWVRIAAAALTMQGWSQIVSEADSR
jgi:hypothetical protein